MHEFQRSQGRRGAGALPGIFATILEDKVHRSAQAFICGPGPYMDAAVAALQAIEMPSERIFVERFASLPDEETLAAANAVAQAAPPLPGAVDEAVVEVLLDGETHQIHCSGNETLLEAALSHVTEASGPLPPDQPDMPIEPLSERENDVLALMVNGFNNSAIAASLSISVPTCSA